MQITDSMVGGAVVISIEHDRLDRRCGVRLKASLRRALRRTKIGIVLDFARVELVDSTGLSVVVGLLRLAGSEGCPLVICGPSEAVRTLFKLTRMDRVVPLFAESSEAIASLTR